MTDLERTLERQALYRELLEISDIPLEEMDAEKIYRKIVETIKEKGDKEFFEKLFKIAPFATLDFMAYITSELSEEQRQVYFEADREWEDAYVTTRAKELKENDSL